MAEPLEVFLLLITSTQLISILLHKIVFIEENKIWSPCMEYHQSNPRAIRVHQ